jgi:ABC-type antimicrobial peptide transport system permease subunit
MYLPQAQQPDSFLTIVVRTTDDPTLVAAPVRAAVARVAPDVPVYDVAPLEALVDRSVGSRRFVMRLLELFGGVALVLTGLGIYGVISSAVAARTREIGVRAALGARPFHIIRLVLGQGLAIVAAGLAVGLLLAWPAARLLSDSLYATTAADPATLLAATGVLVVVALVALVGPVAKATAVDPTVAIASD